MVFLMMRWWYGRGWLLAVQRTGVRASAAVARFSVGQLLGSLFAPWHRIVSAGGRDLATKFQDMVGNLVSRLVGFVVRLSVLFAALIVFIGIGVFGIVEIVGWPLLPVACVYCVVRGVTG